MRHVNMIAIAGLLLAGCVADGDGVGDEKVNETTQAATSTTQVCTVWECSWDVCGYDTATDPRGACCVKSGTAAAPKPSCDPGYPKTDDDPAYYPADYCVYHPTETYCR